MQLRKIKASHIAFLRDQASKDSKDDSSSEYDSSSDNDSSVEELEEAKANSEPQQQEAPGRKS
jgi:hypothetical protein